MMPAAVVRRWFGGGFALMPVSMKLVILVLCVSIGTLRAAAQDSETPAPENENERAPDPIREAYRLDADGYVFYHDADRKQPLERIEKPIMRWTNDNDWSGDVFAWTHEGRPEVVGCILSGPGASGLRYVFHEFHLLAEQPIASADLQTQRRWEPHKGLAIAPVPDAGQPAATASARLAQMRRISRDFSAHMQADGTWELRLLPQPLLRYGNDARDVVDGALFTYVWTKGTDPELVLLVECRRAEAGLVWYFAPVRFSNREVWLKHHGQEVWRVEAHHEPPGNLTTEPYTTAFARSVPQPER
jgi:hypothetical protein